MRMRAFKKFVAITMASLLVMNMAPIGLAQAKMVTTAQVIEQSAPSDDRAQVLTFLMREDVQQ
jgi:Family of unknown function (DUF6627)